MLATIPSLTIWAMMEEDLREAWMMLWREA